MATTEKAAHLMNYYIQPELLANCRAPEQTTWNIDAMRAEADRMFANARDWGARILDVAGIEVRMFSASNPERLLIAPHGGGYVAGRARFDDERNAFLAERFQAVVVSPEYRLAPEYPFPAGKEDVLTVARWAMGEFAHLPAFFYGDSAGSGLSFSAACELDGLAGLVLLEPCLDPSMACASYITHADGPVWTKQAAVYAWRAYVGGSEAIDVMPRVDDVNPEVFPPTLVVVNPVDPLRDEGIALATGLVDRGVECSLHMWEGTFHGALAYPVDSWREMNGVIGRFFSLHS